MKSTLLTLVSMLLIIHTAKAQQKETYLGLRAGVPNGITIKHHEGFFAGEVQAVYRRGGLRAVALAELMIPFYSDYVYGLDAFIIIGGGGHVGKDYIFPSTQTEWKQPRQALGLDAIIGVEFHFELGYRPCSFTIDWKPEWEARRGWKGYNAGVGMSLRVRLSRR